MNVMRQQKHLSAAKKYIFSSIAAAAVAVVVTVDVEEVADVAVLEMKRRYGLL